MRHSMCGQVFVSETLVATANSESTTEATNQSPKRRANPKLFRTRLFQIAICVYLIMDGPTLCVFFFSIN
jgi:hypothetical protein